MTAETVIVDEARLTPSLLSGEFDGSAALWKDSERESVLIYSQPYLENRLILVGRQGSDVSAALLADLAGKRIALVAGYAYGEAVETTDGPIIVGSNSEENSVAKLLKGNVDYTLMDDLVIQYLISNHAEFARTRLAFGSAPLLIRSLHLAVRRSLPDAESIISRFNAAILGMIADRSYHRLLHLDWIRADVDGDGLREYVPPRRQNRPARPGAFLRPLRVGQADHESPARRGGSTSAATSTKAGPACPKSSRPRISPKPNRVDSRSKSSPSSFSGSESAWRPGSPLKKSIRSAAGSCGRMTALRSPSPNPPIRLDPSPFLLISQSIDRIGLSRANGLYAYSSKCNDQDQYRTPDKWHYIQCCLIRKSG